MTFVEHRDVVDNGAERTETRVATSRFVFSPGQILAGILGLIVAVIGVMTVSRAGLDGSLNVPIVRVAGIDQSAVLGLAELVVGLLLILGSLSASAGDLIIFLGVVMVVGGVVIGAGGTTILRDLGVVHSTGWLIMVGGIIAVVAGSLGRIVQTRHTVKSV